MHSFLVNLLIGIIGGIYSSIIVSRVFLLRAELEEQLNILRKKTYYFGTLTAFFDVTEMILKLQSDTSDEIDEEIKQNPDYLKTHDIVRVSDVINTMKLEMLDKTVERICCDDNPLVLKQKQFIALRNETEKIVRKYKDIKDFKFKTVDDSKKEIKELEQKYELCLSKRNKYMVAKIFTDKTMIVLCMILIALCVSIFLVK